MRVCWPAHHHRAGVRLWANDNLLACVSMDGGAAGLSGQGGGGGGGATSSAAVPVAEVAALPPPPPPDMSKLLVEFVMEADRYPLGALPVAMLTHPLLPRVGSVAVREVGRAGVKRRSVCVGLRPPVASCVWRRGWLASASYVGSDVCVCVCVCVCGRHWSAS